MSYLNCVLRKNNSDENSTVRRYR